MVFNEPLYAYVYNFTSDGEFADEPGDRVISRFIFLCGGAPAHADR